MVAALCCTFGYTIAGHHYVHDNIAPLSGLQWLLWITCWLRSGLYAVVSWRRGGQTLGMRPWRLAVVGADGSVPSWRALCVRYAVGTVSLLAAGLGFWWAWVRSEEHTSELQSLMRISYAVFCLKKKKQRHIVLQVVSDKNNM